MAEVIFDGNCAAIARKNRVFASEIISSRPEGVKMEAARSGDYTFKYSGRYFHSTYDPWKEAEAQAGEILSKKPDWVLLFGLGCGYLLKSLIKNRKEKIIVFEPSLDIIASVLRKMDLSTEFSLPDVHICGALTHVINIIRDYTDGLDSLLGYHTTPYKLAFPHELVNFTSKVQNAHITNKVGISTDITSRLNWIDNYFTNVKYFPDFPPIDALKDRFKGMPMIIVGAGPSLRKNAHLLKEVKGRAVILAAITAYKPLVNFGVVPDFIISAEKVDMPEYFTGGPEDRQVRLILGEVSHAKMFERDVLEKFIFFTPYLNLSVGQAGLWGSRYMPSTGGSVTTTALDLGIMFGCDPITFIGQDLCFGENVTHAPGSLYVGQNLTIDKEKGEVRLEQFYTEIKPENARQGRFDLLWLKGLDGRPVPSKFDWVTFHQWFENYMAFIKKEGIPVKVINATEGGAYIEGMEHTALREVIDKYMRKDIDLCGIIDEAVEKRTPPDFNSLRALFEEMRDNVNKMRGDSLDLMKEVTTAQKKYGEKGLSIEMNSNVDRIRRKEEALFKKIDSVPFIWESLTAYTYRLKEYLREEEDSKGGRFKKDLQAMFNSYENISDMCGRFLPVLDGSIEFLRERVRGVGADGASNGRDRSACC